MKTLSVCTPLTQGDIESGLRQLGLGRGDAVEVHRVCTWGRDARLHAQGYQHLLDVDGWVLLISVDIWRCSSMHLAERVPIPAEIAAHFSIPDEIQRDYPEVVTLYEDLRRSDPYGILASRVRMVAALAARGDEWFIDEPYIRHRRTL